MVHASWPNLHPLFKATPQNVCPQDILNELRRDVPVQNAPTLVPVGTYSRLPIACVAGVKGVGVGGGGGGKKEKKEGGKNER